MRWLRCSLPDPGRQAKTRPTRRECTCAVQSPQKPAAMSSCHALWDRTLGKLPRPFASVAVHQPEYQLHAIHLREAAAAVEKGPPVCIDPLLALCRTERSVLGLEHS
eukprot:3476904-Prymnesium_polylepis.2